jgi:Cu(I)/Ag(I) efflux system membrane fusion protein
MKNILLVFVLVISINAKTLDYKQSFNRSITTVKEVSFAHKKTFFGKISYDETKIQDVVLRFSGFIKDLTANYLHKQIRKNEKLFSIYSKEVSIALDELILATNNTNSRYFIKDIEKRLELLGVNKSTIRKAKKTQKIPYYIDIISSYNGIIIKKYINESSYAKEGKMLFQIADLSTVWVDVNIYQKDLSFISKDMIANVMIDGVGSFKSKVDFIHPVVDNKTKTIIVRLILKNKNMKILPGMFTTAIFEQKKQTMLVVPKSAVITKGSTNYVFKSLEDDEFEPIEVKAKRINSLQFQILSGLKKGDKIINNSLFMLDSDAVTNGLYESDDDW